MFPCFEPFRETGKLNPRIHCGEYISPLASLCPTDRPNGVTCRICGGRLRSEDALRVQSNSGSHRQCLAPQFAFVDLSCPLCNRAVTHKHFSFDKLLEDSSPDCPHCGDPNMLRSIGNCDYCNLPITEALGHENSAPYGSTKRCHDSCIQQEKDESNGALVRMANLPLLATLTVLAAASYRIFLLVRNLGG